MKILDMKKAGMGAVAISYALLSMIVPLVAMIGAVCLLLYGSHLVTRGVDFEQEKPKEQKKVSNS